MKNSNFETKIGNYAWIKSYDSFLSFVYRYIWVKWSYWKGYIFSSMGDFLSLKKVLSFWTSSLSWWIMILTLMAIIKIFLNRTFRYAFEKPSVTVVNFSTFRHSSETTVPIKLRFCHTILETFLPIWWGVCSIYTNIFQQKIASKLGVAGKWILLNLPLRFLKINIVS